MSKTAREVIEEHLSAIEVGGEGARPWTAATFVDFEGLNAALDAAGFVIMKRPKGDGLAIPDYVPPEATPEQLREVIENIGGLLMQNGYEANNYLDLHAALFAIVVHFQHAQYIVEELETMFEEAKEKGRTTIESAVGARFNKRVEKLMGELRG